MSRLRLLAGGLACWVKARAGIGGHMGVVVGYVVDGVPESIIAGLQALPPSAELAASGWVPGNRRDVAGSM